MSETISVNAEDFKITIRGFDITKDVRNLSIKMKPDGSLQASVMLVSNEITIKPDEISIYDKEKEI